MDLKVGDLIGFYENGKYYEMIITFSEQLDRIIKSVELGTTQIVNIKRIKYDNIYNTNDDYCACCGVKLTKDNKYSNFMCWDCKYGE